MTNLLASWREHARSRYPAHIKLWLFCKKHRVAVFALLVILLGLVFFSGLIKMVIIGAIFIVAGAFSMLYSRWIRISLGIELIMLGFVLMTVLYGPIPGIIVGVIGLFWAEVITARFTYSTFVSFIGIGIMGFAIPFLPFQDNIALLGIVTTVLYDIIIIPGYLLLGSEPWRSFVFAFGHIVFNVWLFVGVAPWMLPILEAIV